MVQGRLINFRKPDQNAGAHGVDQVQIEALMAKNAGSRQIIQPVVGLNPVFEENILVFLRPEAAALAGVVIALKHFSPDLGLKVRARCLTVFARKVLGIA